MPEPDATGLVGDTGLRGEGGVTSVCSIVLKIAFACSAWRRQSRCLAEVVGGDSPLRASDSEGIILFFEGVDGPPSSIR
jgi:hypothetical protein